MTVISPSRIPMSGFQFLDGARDVCRHWEQQLAPGDPRHREAGEVRRFLETCILAADDSQDALASAYRLMCAQCATLHPGLASLCSGSGARRQENCWLLKGYRCPVAVFPEPGRAG